MAIHLIDATDPIEISFVPMLIFGPPGCGKTSMAQTASKTLTLDFDAGIHRAANRKKAVQFDTWADCLEAGQQGMFKDYETLVIDTGGRALDKMIPGILQESPKNGYAGALTPQGWGVLGSRFTTWMKTVATWGKQVVFVCHQEEAKNAGGDSYFLPDLPGKMSYKEIHKSFDLIGRIRYEGRKRILDFNPSDNSIGKNAAGWPAIEVPDLHTAPTFLADLIADAKSRIGKTAEASADIAKTVSDWQARLAKDPGLAEFNGMLPEYKALGRTIKPQIKAMLEAHAKQVGWKFDVKNETFYAPNLPSQESAA